MVVVIVSSGGGGSVGDVGDDSGVKNGNGGSSGICLNITSLPCEEFSLAFLLSSTLVHPTLMQYLLLSSLRISFPLPSAFSLPPSSSSRLACLPRNLSHQTFLRVSQLCLIKHHGATTLRETRHTRFCLRSQTWHNVLPRPQACEVREAIALYTRHGDPTLRYYSGIFPLLLCTSGIE